MRYLYSHIDGVKIFVPEAHSSSSDVFKVVCLYDSNEFDGFDCVMEKQWNCLNGQIVGLFAQVSKDLVSTIIRSVEGIAHCVVVDLRIDSETYGESLVLQISDINKFQVYIPEGFAWGFACISDKCKIVTKHNKHDIMGIFEENILNPLDEELGLDWSSAANPIFKGKSFDDIEKY